MPSCFSRSSINFQGHTGQKIADLDLNWGFPYCNSNLHSSMDSKWCTKLDVHVVYMRWPIIFSGSSIKFEGHTGCKIYNLNPVWVRLLGRLDYLILLQVVMVTWSTCRRWWAPEGTLILYKNTTMTFTFICQSWLFMFHFLTKVLLLSKRKWVLYSFVMHQPSVHWHI